MILDLDAEGAPTASYLNGPSGLSQECDYRSGHYHVFAFDPQGLPVQMSRSTDNLSTLAAFIHVHDGCGCLWSDQSTANGTPGSQPPSVGYIAQWGVYTDWETRPSGDKTPLPLMGVRYYDPYTGRFLARDPIADSLNWYSYANGNPVRYIDPTGESAWDTIKAGAAWVVGLPERAAVGAVRAAVKVLSRGATIDKNKGIAADIHRARTANNNLKAIDPALDAVIARNQQAPGKAGKAYYEQTTQAAGIALLAVATTINWGNQNKHLPGRNLESDKSIVTVPESRIPVLIQQFTGKGVPNTKAFKFGQPGYREIVDCGENIGLVWDNAGRRWVTTSRATLHYSKAGVHMVPKW